MKRDEACPFPHPPARFRAEMMERLRITGQIITSRRRSIEIVEESRADRMDRALIES